MAESGLIRLDKLLDNGIVVASAVVIREVDVVQVLSTGDLDQVGRGLIVTVS